MTRLFTMALLALSITAFSDIKFECSGKTWIYDRVYETDFLQTGYCNDEGRVMPKVLGTRSVYSHRISWWNGDPEPLESKMKYNSKSRELFKYKKIDSFKRRITIEGREGSSYEMVDVYEGKTHEFVGNNHPIKCTKIVKAETEDALKKCYEASDKIIGL